MRVKVAIDLGSRNMKMAGSINGIIEKKLIESKARKQNAEERNAVQIEGYDKIYFGVGYPLWKKDKRQREYVLESIFLTTQGIYGKLGDNFEVDIAIGLPMKTYVESKDSYLEELNNLYLNKTFTCVANNQNITIKITYINIYAEGLSGFFALENMIKMDRPILMIDVGYKTTDFVGFVYDSFTEEISVDNFRTVPMGLKEIYESIAKQFNHDNKPSDITPEKIDEYITNGWDINIPTNRGVERKNPNQWIKYGDTVVLAILNDIETNYFPDFKNRNLYIIGGGVESITSIIESMSNEDKMKSVEYGTYQKNTKESDMLLYANVKGYLMQLKRDVPDIVQSEDIFKSDKKLEGEVAISKE